jgi:hypothetical protein
VPSADAQEALDRFSEEAFAHFELPTARSRDERKERISGCRRGLREH